ncbi:hypothetical protein ACMGGR_16990 [Erwinia sp. BNK-24-b]|uniref:hypothetical protein n=1 Tax=unclassified Erwinia TaxID=2622719 RepID=UPI0039BFBBFD
MKAYFKLLIYSCFFCVLLGFFLIGAGALFIYFTKGYLFFPAYHVKRVVVFGCIAGTSITLYVLIVNLMNKFKARKNPPSDPE